MHIRYFYIKDHVDSGSIVIEYCATDDMTADFFTKPLQGKKFKQFRDQVMNLALNSKYHSEHRSVLSDEEEMDEDNLSDSTGKLYADMKVESTEGAERMNSVVVNTDESEEDTSD